ncbi:hypothetical protein F7R11_17345 [Ralstonia insidiosa]|nr:hypothetical protein F7R11_17345 [Ralstonia insidiosa]
MPAAVLQAVRPYSDFIQRYLTVNSRSSSPINLYDKSYGTPRTNMLALESAGEHLTGIVLQSDPLPGCDITVLAFDRRVARCCIFIQLFSVTPSPCFPLLPTLILPMTRVSRVTWPN